MIGKIRHRAVDFSAVSLSDRTARDAASMSTPHTKTTDPTPGAGDPAAALLRGRACYERHEWNDAFEALSLADRSMALGPDDLHRLAWSGVQAG